jgi:hypothetical protein
MYELKEMIRALTAVQLSLVDQRSVTFSLQNEPH